jgi:pimeloyl-ACP methyl ester carboxylesterase
MVEAGPSDGPAFVFLHGWPQSWRSWAAVMTLTASDARAIALDLPCIGDSTGPLEGGSKRELAALVHTLVDNLGLTDVTLVGHDVGGMVAYSYLRQYDDVARVVILDTVIPGVDPWNEVVRNPNIWHFAFHAIASLASARAGPPNRLLRVLLRRAVRRSDKAHPRSPTRVGRRLPHRYGPDRRLRLLPRLSPRRRGQHRLQRRRIGRHPPSFTCAGTARSAIWRPTRTGYATLGSTT